MNGDALQHRVDRARATSPQRWRLGVVAFVAAIAASVVANVASGDWSVVLLGLVVVLALVTVLEPDSHTGAWVVGIVVAQWLILVDDVSTPATTVVAVCLLVFHTIVSLMALTPAGATVDRAILWRWSARAAVVAVGTVAMWALVATFDRWRLPGGTALTVAAFVVLAAGVGALVVRSYR